MANPTTRAEFKEWCLRRIGKPVIEINVTDDQVEDCIDEALQYFADYHYSGSEKQYFSYEITQLDIDNQYVTLPNGVQGVVQIFPIGDPVSTGSDIFNIQYQIALNDLYSLTSVSMVPYYMVMEHISLIRELLVGRQPTRFNKHQNRVYLDFDTSKLQVGNFVIFELYAEIDPETYPDVWNDRWLKDYTKTLIQEQWGMNLTKYRGVQMAGGVEFNGDEILSRATEKKMRLEQEMISSYSMPVTDLIG